MDLVRDRIKLSETPLPGEEDLEAQRRRNEQKLQGRFSAIYSKYDRDFSERSDVIDLETGAIVVDNGHLWNMRHERDIGKIQPRGRPGHGRVAKKGQAEQEEDEEDELATPSRTSRSILSNSLWRSEDPLEGVSTGFSNDLAARVVRSAVPSQSDCDLSDPAFVTSFSENIMKQVAEVMKAFQPMQIAPGTATSAPARVLSDMGSVRQANKSPEPTKPRGDIPASPGHTAGAIEERAESEDSPSDQVARRSSRSVSPAAPPRGNPKHNPWSQQEEELLRELMRSEKRNWTKIKIKLPKRTVTSIYQRWHAMKNQCQEPATKIEVKAPSVPITQGRAPSTIPIPQETAEHDEHYVRRIPRSGRAVKALTSPWNEEESQLLLHLKDAEHLSFGDISERLPGRTWQAAKEHYLCLLKDDTLPSTGVRDPEKVIPTVHELANSAIAPNRSSIEAPRSRQSQAKGRRSLCGRGDLFWQEDEDAKLIHMRENQGLTWPAIASHFPTRTTHGTAMRYNKYLKPQLSSGLLAGPLSEPVGEMVMSQEPEATMSNDETSSEAPECIETASTHSHHPSTSGFMPFAISHLKNRTYGALVASASPVVDREVPRPRGVAMRVRKRSATVDRKTARSESTARQEPEEAVVIDLEISQPSILKQREQDDPRGVNSETQPLGDETNFQPRSEEDFNPKKQRRTQEPAQESAGSTAKLHILDQPLEDFCAVSTILGQPTPPLHCGSIAPRPVPDTHMPIDSPFGDVSTFNTVHAYPTPPSRHASVAPTPAPNMHGALADRQESSKRKRKRDSGFCAQDDSLPSPENSSPGAPDRGLTPVRHPAMVSPNSTFKIPRRLSTPVRSMSLGPSQLSRNRRRQMSPRASTPDPRYKVLPSRARKKARSHLSSISQMAPIPECNSEDELSH